METNEQKVCLTIAGLDPSGGAGVIADLKTFTAFGCYGAAAVSSITFQNTQEVYGSVSQTAETVRGQLEPVFMDLPVAAVKTGMLPTADVIEETARILKAADIDRLVVDPVVRSTSGYDLIDDVALRSLVENLFPIALIITPNIPEAERIAEMKITGLDDIRMAAEKMRLLGARNVLIKGGHAEFAPGTSDDHLLLNGEMHILEGEYVDSRATHGTGCTLAAAIAAGLALDAGLHSSVIAAKRFVEKGIRTSPMLGRGHPSLNHLIDGRECLDKLTERA